MLAYALEDLRLAGFVDLHCHWIAAIDDGARDVAQSLEMLRGLRALGFGFVVATPHMRPGMFDNSADDLRRAYAAMRPSLDGERDLPLTALSSEHYLDDVVLARLLGGAALPYPGHAAALLEFHQSGFPPSLPRQLFDLQRRGLRPVLAHPERYQQVWRNPEVVEELVDAGAGALLDVAALIGKYGSRAERAARDLLEAGVYHAACSDAHAPRDLAGVAEAMEWIRRRHGQEEVDFLFRIGPLTLLNGQLPE